ncbi:hypothetical protein [Pedobacter frigiditerrae]|uniref:hypothetical protein n=1 Tax=Pedobacter frigiditerrae TaxID=2530452 RepID=UPI00292EDCEC|nr:hypothetical protein [Pedobacter frigiditerrae]
MTSEIVVSNSFAFTLLLGAALFIGKSIYDLIKNEHLSKSEKVSLAFVISLLPIYGSFIFYMYAKNIYKAGRYLRN